jgi:phage terminase large subunit GpA-like protein
VEQGDSIEPNSLISRLEVYPDTLPTLLATAGVDVQKDRLEATLVDWDASEQAWVRDHHILPGDTTQPAVWDDLAELLRDNRIQLACIDAGYNTANVMSFCEPRPWCVPTKGIPGPYRPLVEDEKKRKQRLLTRRKRGQPIEPIGVDPGKALLYARLKLAKPGPGYVHFPQLPAFDDEYFAQLAAEKLVTKVRGTRPFTEWVQTRPRNEALDCLLLNLAAFRLAALLVARGYAAPGAPKASAAAPAATAATPSRTAASMAHIHRQRQAARRR